MGRGLTQDGIGSTQGHGFRLNALEVGDEHLKAVSGVSHQIPFHQDFANDCGFLHLHSRSQQ